MSVFNCHDYREFLTSAPQLLCQGKAWGSRSVLARAARCQVSYVSRVLEGNADFSLEQADAIAGELELSPAECDYFLVLVQRARAGTPSLRARLDTRLATLRQERLFLANRLGIANLSSAEVQRIYYSSWHFAAIHILVGEEKGMTAPALASRLNITKAMAEDALDFLIAAGFVRRSKDGPEVGLTETHLPAAAEMIVAHHTNWRLRAIRAIEERGKTNCHYSGVIGISEADAERARDMTVSYICQMMELAKNSKHATTFALGIDFFRL